MKRATLKVSTSKTPLQQKRRNSTKRNRSVRSDDSSLYLHIREYAVSWLKTFPSVKAWVIGNEDDQIAHELSVLFEDEGIKRWCVYITDSNAFSLLRGTRYSISSTRFKRFEEYHRRSGGKAPLKKYYIKKGPRFLLKKKLSENVYFFQHHLESDASFNEFQLIISRDAIRPLTPNHRSNAQKVILGSLCHLGILMTKEQTWIDSVFLKENFRELGEGCHFYKRVD